MIKMYSCIDGQARVMYDTLGYSLDVIVIEGKSIGKIGCSQIIKTFVVQSVESRLLNYASHQSNHADLQLFHIKGGLKVV